jgi:hypothetical protein
MTEEFKAEISVKSNNTSARRAKIEKLKLDHSATSIQASWRGRSHRQQSKKVVPLISNEDDDGIPDEKENIEEEQNLALSAEDEEERQIERIKSSSKLLAWPDSLEDELDNPNWPKLGPSTSSSGKLLVVSDEVI